MSLPYARWLRLKGDEITLEPDVSIEIVVYGRIVVYGNSNAFSARRIYSYMRKPIFQMCASLTTDRISIMLNSEFHSVHIINSYLTITPSPSAPFHTIIA